MNPRVLVAALLALVSCPVIPAQTSVRAQRFAAAYLLAFGTAPAAGSAVTDGASVGSLYAELRTRLRRDPTLARDARTRALGDAFGRSPSAADLAAVPADAVTYAEVLKAGVASLASDSPAYAAVIGRAYRLVLERDPYPEEIAYWAGRPVESFAMLVGCVENWARRNAPGLMATSGAPTIARNSPYLVTIGLLPAIAAEAQDAIGLDSAVGVSAAQRVVVAPTAANIRSVSGMPFVAAGNPARLFPPAG
ncbi:MAG TPA: hypothetical protein VHE61_11615 [Opitutaceae bacterium]|nr:hypothetical protein [Opitutaceae bacterium]